MSEGLRGAVLRSVWRERMTSADQEVDDVIHCHLAGPGGALPVREATTWRGLGHLEGRTRREP